MAVDTTDILLERLVTVRHNLVVARAELRSAEDDFQFHSLIAEQQLIVKANGDSKALGSNETDRKRAFASAVATDPACRDAKERLRLAQEQTEALQAELDGLNDTRRLRDLANRERIVTLIESGVALEHLGRAI